MCEICGKSSCTRSFHSLEAQEKFDRRKEMSNDVDVLKMQLQDAQEELETLKRELEEARMEIDGKI